MVGCKYSIDDYRSPAENTIGTILNNPKMSKFVSDYLKNK